MQIVYAAHTRGCTFQVDAEGICRRVLARGEDAETMDEHGEMQRCVGAQLVGALDGVERRLLLEVPAIGTPMLFAFVGELGKIRVVRTAPVEQLESLGDDSGVYERKTLEELLPSTDRAPSCANESGVAETADARSQGARTSSLHLANVYELNPVETPRRATSSR